MAKYKCGQEVLRDLKPFSYYVHPNYLTTVCDCCLKMCEREGILKACARCHLVYYCDQNCQKLSWKSHHKFQCKYLQRKNMPENVKEMFDGHSEFFLPFTLEILRTIYKLNNNGREEFFQLPNGKKRYFEDLVSNAKELRMQLIEMNILNDWHDLYENFLCWIGDSLPSFADFFDIFAKWRTNSCGIDATNFDNPCTGIAAGLYLGYSALDHSCDFNAVWINVGKEMIVRTIHEVENFSDVRISYIDVTKKTQDRKKVLKEHYFFDCKCLRCEDANHDAKHTSLKCKNCPGWVYEKTKICSWCHTSLKLSEEDLTIIEHYKNGTLSNVEPTMSINEIRYSIQKYVNIFHGFHDIFFQLFSKFPNLALKNKNREYLLLVLELKKLSINYYSGHLPQFDEGFVFHQSGIAKICIELMLFEEAEFHLKKAEEICKVAYGKDHPYMLECQKIQNHCQLK